MLNKEKLIKKYQKVPVVEYQNKTSTKPFVSILVQTYQHANYIGKCLDGILMQKTNFDIEILVGEDDSSDGTRDICIQYAKKHPDKIKLFLHSRENNIKVYGNPSGMFNLRYNIFSAKGEYIAFCDGDDYWTDPLKLQKQLDYLEANKDYGLVHSDILMINEEGKEIEFTPSYFRQIKRRKNGFIFWQLLEKNFISTLTVCTRRELLADYFNKFPDEEFAYDHRIWLHIASYAKVMHFNEKIASYRVHSGGISRSNDFFKERRPRVRQSALLHYLSIIKNNSRLIDRGVFSKITYTILMDKTLSKEDKKPLIKVVKKHPKYMVYIFLYQLVKIWSGFKNNILVKNAINGYQKT